MIDCLIFLPASKSYKPHWRDFPIEYVHSK
jgi:hypothetical protein